MKELTHTQFDALRDLVLTGILAAYGCIAVLNLTVYGVRFFMNFRF